jgi:hypothetical protein
MRIPQAAIEFSQWSLRGRAAGGRSGESGGLDERCPVGERRDSDICQLWESRLPQWSHGLWHEPGSPKAFGNWMAWREDDKIGCHQCIDRQVGPALDDDDMGWQDRMFVSFGCASRGRFATEVC